MVEIVFHQAHFFRRIVDSLKGLVEEITFECDSNGMNLQAMDVSHVSLISIDLPESCFETYSCEGGLSLSFNVETLVKVLKSAGSNDVLTIRTEKEKEDIEIQLAAPTDDKITKFKLKPIDVDADAVSIPEHTYRAKLTFSSNALSKLVKSLAEVDDSVVVRCNEGSVTFSVSASTFNSSTTFTSGGPAENADEEIEIDVSEECKVSYALRYLKVISGSSALANRVTLCFSPHFPLLVEYDMNEGGFVRFYLAPKVEDSGSEDEI
ncbi:proliferating cell nuclear antigen [Tritrichomonas foetus]|uniref:DNA sliding clamp PCNA n=1 Tax=Tritrichomonas foetus TaxID=1144522 RepID=A0A1J4KB87_9EUKA|nr:proliferating cell nuclear antigen [Tritrichomonas foetus]|eukprot:OHT08681.1 proliferating cell nuclear antigen [Tritrichomonas foetus]